MEYKIVSILTKKLGKEMILTGNALSERYTHIWRMDEPLKAKAVCLPRSAADVSAIMKICHKHKQPVVVHGGLTNLVGSTETTPEDIVISTEKMNTITEVDEMSRTITVQSGVILENIQSAAKEHDLLFPLNFGAKGSAQIGGIISTNAGGLRVFRFGMTRNLVLGLEAVLADGTVISSLKKIIKDNSGYDLKQLFIGSEGTLGVITKAVLKLVEAPKSRVSAFAAFNDYKKVINFLKYTDKGLSGTLSGFELIWEEAYKKMTSPPASSNPPVKYGYKYYVLLEALGNNPEEDQDRLQALLEKAFEKELILDAVLAHTASDLEWFWTIREDVHILSSQVTFDHHFDISLPIGDIGHFVDAVSKELSVMPGVEAVFPFGHIADGNVHFIIGRANDDEQLITKINDIVYSPLKKLGGSVSAEHGIGLDKKPYLHISRSKDEIKLMNTLKKTMDPHRILNRGKVVD